MKGSTEKKMVAKKADSADRVTSNGGQRQLEVRNDTDSQSYANQHYCIGFPRSYPFPNKPVMSKISFWKLVP